MTPPLNPTSTSAAIPSGNPFTSTGKVLDWSRSVIERKWGFRGGRFTNPGKLLSLIAGLMLTTGFYTALILAQQKWPQIQWFSGMFLERGPCPYPTMLLFALFPPIWRKLMDNRAP